MSEKKVHYARTEKVNRPYQVFHKNELVLESDAVVRLHEHYDGKDFPPVIYFPNLDDLDVSRTELRTHCPIKGDASYWSFRDAESGIWSYEEPKEGMEEIKGFYGFDLKKGFRVEPKKP